MFRGSIVAIVTPFKGGKVDEKALGNLIEWHIKEGTDAIVPCGTTGESATLDYKEHFRVIRFTVEAVNHRVPVIAGTGANATDETILITREAKKAGADAALLVSPYYNKPTQEGLYQHFRAIATAVPLPMIVYNIQGRTGVNIETTTLKRLSEIDNIVAVKEASGNISQMAAVLHAMPDTFDVLCGDDPITIPLIALGGRGVISVVSNEIPAEMTKLTQLALHNDFPGARAVQRTWMPLMEVNFVESNPIPVKAAMAMMGLLEPVWRLPMTPPLAQHQAKIEAVLKSLGLLAGARSTHAD
jgi:4-hydroxy-tetrahydrodipicolinate synthase